MAQYLEISREKVEGFLRDLNGQMVSVDFLRKDGVRRTINGRLGVKKYTNGGHNQVAERPDLPYVVIWEAPKPQEPETPGRDRYRNLNLSTIECIRGAGKDVLVV